MAGPSDPQVPVPGEGTTGPGHGAHHFWLGHVRLGVGMSAVVVAMIALYLLATPEDPQRPAIWAVVATAAVLTVVMGLLPWRRLVAAGRALPVMVTWTLCLVPMVVLLAAVDGGARSPFALLLVVPLVFSTLAYPVRVTVLVGGTIIAGQVGIVLSTPGVRLHDVVLQGTVMALITLMGTLTSRNHWRTLAREEDLAEQLRQLADRDGLTGCLNHRGFHERLDVEVARSLRSGQPLALLHADLDHFKGINDGHGHPVGDEVLASVGQLLRDDARPTDVVGRVGGEEFALLLPGSTLSDARTVAERLREAVTRLDHPVRVTMSIGVSALREVADTQEHLVATADQALYAAKRSGRDRVVTAAGVAGRPPSSTASRPAAVTHRV